MTTTNQSTGHHRWLALIAIALGVFMALIDTTVVNVALPKIQTSLTASYADLQWIISSYTIVFSVLLLIWAKLGDLYGRKRMFIIGLVIFTVGSFLDAVSVNVAMLHICRGLQAVGGSALMSLSFALIGTIFAGKERGIALGILASVIGLSTASGPLLGGLLVDHYSWQSIFTINLPVGIVTIIMVYLFVSSEQEYQRNNDVDICGMLLSAGMIFTLVFGFVQKEMHPNQSWLNLHVSGYLLTSLILLAAFIWRELSAKNPMMDLSMFKSLSFTGSVAIAFLLGIGLYGFFPYLSLFMQNYCGYSASQTGLRQAMISVFSLVLGPITGILTSKIRHGYILATSSLFIGAGLLILSCLITETATFADFWPAFIFIGIGNGSINTAMTTAGLSAVKKHQLGAASGMISTFLQVGVSFGVVLQGLLLSDGYQHKLLSNTSSLQHIPSQTISSLCSKLVNNGPFSGNVVLTSQPFKQLPHIDKLLFWVRQSFDSSFITVTRVNTLIFVVASVVAIICVRSGKHDQASL